MKCDDRRRWSGGHRDALGTAAQEHEQNECAGRAPLPVDAESVARFAPQSLVQWWRLAASALSAFVGSWMECRPQSRLATPDK